MVSQFERKALRMSDTWANAHPTVLENSDVPGGGSAATTAAAENNLRKHDEV